MLEKDGIVFITIVSICIVLLILQFIVIATLLMKRTKK
ncbi:MAG: hypothetical protein ACJAV9_000309 [Urechidicola sp.]|jgi:hypothetical protein